MGLFMLCALVGGVLYGGHILKNDLQAEIIDKKNTPTANQGVDNYNIRHNFINICKRAGIKLSKTNKPINQNECHKGIEYLQLQGYNPDSVLFFEKVFIEKYNEHQNAIRHKINTKHQVLMNKYKNSTRQYTYITYRHNHYQNDEPNDRMQKIMNNKLWQTIVDNYTYVRSTNNAKYTEIWNLKVPKNFFNNYNIDTLYQEVCWKENLHHGGFI